MLQNQFSRILFVTDNFFYINDLGVFILGYIKVNPNKMQTVTNKKPLTNYSCTICHFNSSNKKDYNRHLSTAKHKNLIKTNEKTQIKTNAFMCSCGKIYKHSSTLCAHKKTCNYIHDNNVIEIQNEIQYDEVQNPAHEPTSEASTVLRLLKQNDEFKKLMTEQYNVMTERLVELQEKNQELNQQLIAAIKDGNGTVINNNNTNNNHFNLNFFLNDTCKDAMNITDFLQNLDVQIEEIEYIGNHGYVNGMTKMIMDRLKGMDITKRPIHCTDIKRETMYIKDNDEWSKDTDELTKLRRILHCIIMSNYRTVPKWKTAHPDCEEVDSRDYNFCYNMMRLILGDLEDEQVKLDNKIIKTLSKGLFCK